MPRPLHILSLLAMVAILAGRTAAMPDPQIVITFRPTAEVRGSAVLLGDVATVEGQDADLVRALEAVEVGTAPLSGHTRTVSAAYAKIRIRQLRIDLSRVLINGPQLCTVSRPEQVVPGAAVEKAALEAVEAANPGVTAQTSFTPADLRLPVGALEFRPQGVRLFGGTSGTVAVQLLVDGKPQTTVTVSFRLLRRAPAVVAVRDLPVGTVLQADDLRVEERPVLPGPLLLSDPSQAVGQQVAAPVKGGTCITSRMLKPAVVIRRGTRVKLICKADTFTVTATGEALQDATAGQTVRVRNLGSLLELTGIAIGPQAVEVPF